MAQGFTGSQTLVTGSGGANRVAVWASPSTLTSDGNFTYASGTLAIANGKIQANGDGSSYGLYSGSSADVQWYRSATNTWRTPNNVSIDGLVTLGGYAATRVPFFGIGGLVESSADFAFDSTVGQLNLANAGGGLLLGGDVYWYRNAANVWRTPDSVIIDADLTVTTNATFGARTATRIAYFGTAGLLSDDSGLVYDATNDQLQLPTTGSGAGLLVGGDVQWYRSAANTWRTPDSIVIDLGINGGSASGAAAGQVFLKGTQDVFLKGESTNSYGGQVQFVNAASTANDWRLGIPAVVNSRDFFWYDNSSGGAGAVLYATGATGNLGLGNSTSFGTNAARTLRMPGNGASAVAPTGSVTDYFHIYGADAAAGKAWPSFREEGNTGTTRFIVGCDSIQGVSTGTGTVKMNGATSRNSVGWASFTLSDGTTAFFPYWTVITG